MMEGKSSEVHIKEVHPDTFWTVLQYLTCGNLQGDTLNVDDAVDVYRYADVIHLTSLKNIILGLLSKLVMNWSHFSFNIFFFVRKIHISTNWMHSHSRQCYKVMNLDYLKRMFWK